jgi:hypothetical protein
MRLGGWLRLWIVLSILAAIGVFLHAAPEYPSPWLYERLAWNTVQSPTADSSMIANAFAVARAQGQPEQIEAYRRVWWFENSILATLPGILLGLLLLLGAWVRRGFQQARTVAPTAGDALELPRHEPSNLHGS